MTDLGLSLTYPVRLIRMYHDNKTSGYIESFHVSVMPAVLADSFTLFPFSQLYNLVYTRYPENGIFIRGRHCFVG